MTPSTERYFGKEAKGSWDRVLIVDPGLGGTGLAFWATLRRPSAKAIPPDDTNLITPKRHKDWLARVWMVEKAFAAYVRTWKPTLVIIEFQKVWASNPVSVAAATGGDLFKLTLLTGVVAAAAHRSGAEVALVLPGEWKGQLSKPATRNRLKRAFGKKGAFADHVEDAVGMGLSLQGRL